MKKALELWPFTVLITLFILWLLNKILGINALQLVGAFGCWIVCWLIWHCVLGETHPKYGSGFTGYATVTVMWTTAGINPLPFYLGFGLASALMIAQKWDSLSQDLVDTPFWNLGSVLNVIGMYLIPEPTKANQGD